MFASDIRSKYLSLERRSRRSFSRAEQALAVGDQVAEAHHGDCRRVDVDRLRGAALDHPDSAVGGEHADAEVGPGRAQLAIVFQTRRTKVPCRRRPDPGSPIGARRVAVVDEDDAVVGEVFEGVGDVAPRSARTMVAVHEDDVEGRLGASAVKKRSLVVRKKLPLRSVFGCASHFQRGTRPSDRLPPCDRPARGGRPPQCRPRSRGSAAARRRELRPATIATRGGCWRPRAARSRLTAG